MSLAIENKTISDAKPKHIKDSVPGQLVKVYPYELIASNESEEFVGNYTTSIVSVDNSAIDLPRDSQGDAYFEMYAAITSAGLLDYKSGTSTVGKEFKEEESFTAISNYWFESTLEQIKVGGSKIVPAVFTIGKPLDTEEHRTGKQDVYICTRHIESKVGKAPNYGEVHDGLYEFDLTNISAIESSYSNCEIQFTESHPSYTDPTVSLTNGTTIDGFALQVEDSALVGRVTAKGMSEDNSVVEDIDLQLNGKSLMIKSTPVSVQDKVTMFMDWFDYDLVAPYYIAKVMIRGYSIAALARSQYLQDEGVDLLLSAISISVAFKNSFKDLPRYTEADAQKASGVRAGQIKGDVTIGYGNYEVPAINLVGKNALSAVSGLYDTYLLVTGNDDGNSEYQTIKQLTAMLSRYISSNFSIANGDNTFNQIYLPWTFQAIDRLVLRETGGNYSVDKESKFKTQSEYFDINDTKDTTTEGLTLRSNIDISNLQMKQTDRKLTIPPVPYQLSEMNKLPLASDIDTKSSRDLSYFWHMPINDDNVFRTIFLSASKIKIDTKNEIKSVDLPWHDYAHSWSTMSSSAIKQAVIEAAAKKYHAADLTKVQWVSNGSIQKDFSGGEYLKCDASWVSSRNKSGDQSWFGKYFHTLPDTPHNSNVYGGAVPFTEVQQQHLLAEYLGIDVSLIKILPSKAGSRHSPQYIKRGSIKIIQASWSSSDPYGANGFHYQLLRDRLVGAKAQVDGYDIELNRDRQTIFNKSQWAKLLILADATAHAKRYYVLEFKDDVPAGLHINEITVSMLWANEFDLIIGGRHYTIGSFNRNDETVTTQRIIFT